MEASMFVLSTIILAVVYCIGIAMGRRGAFRQTREASRLQEQRIKALSAQLQEAQMTALQRARKKWGMG